LLQEFVQRRVMPQYQEIVFRFCAQMKDQAPDALLRMRGGTEKYYPVPVYRTAKDIVAISPTKTGVTFSFTNGAAFSDPYGLLRGHGKRSRTVVVKRIEDYPVDEMASYMRQAVAMGDL
jgi:hypothetical protein